MGYYGSDNLTLKFNLRKIKLRIYPRSVFLKRLWLHFKSYAKMCTLFECGKGTNGATAHWPDNNIRILEV